jgi:aminoglycoside 6'-N-acetyltransferase I
MTSQITIRRAITADKNEWHRMRLLLWPDESPEALFTSMDEILADPLTSTFVAVRPDGLLGGFLEAGLRKYGEGCETSPIGYLEGWFVDEDLRKQGVGKALVRAAEDWARSQGCSEMGSDTWLDNETSITAHLALGFEENERLVHFRKSL